MSAANCSARTGPVWKLGGEACGCTRAAGHEHEPPNIGAYGDSRNHLCTCGTLWDDSIRRDRPPVTA